MTGGNWVSQASTQEMARITSPDARGSHVQDERTTFPLSTHHIDIADITKQATHARSTTSPRQPTRGTGLESEAKRYDTRDGAKGKEASRGTMTHDRRMTGRVSTMGQTEATPNTDDETTSPTRQASRNERDTRRTAEAPRQMEREPRRWQNQNRLN